MFASALEKWEKAAEKVSRLVTLCLFSAIYLLILPLFKVIYSLKTAFGGKNSGVHSTWQEDNSANDVREQLRNMGG